MFIIQQEFCVDFDAFQKNTIREYVVLDAKHNARIVIRDYARIDSFVKMSSESKIYVGEEHQLIAQLKFMAMFVSDLFV